MSKEIPNKNSLAKGIATYFIEKMPINPNKNSFRKTLNRKYTISTSLQSEWISPT